MPEKMKRPMRLSHAERTRTDILAVTVPLAAKVGLEGLTIGALAEELSMSKAGVFAHFGSKEALQLATVDAAFEQFTNEVLVPAIEAPEGLERLKAFLDAYIAYVLRREEQGGCFFTAASLEFDDRSGEVRKRIDGVLSARTEVIIEELRKAKARRQLKGDPEQLAFEVIALCTGANVEFQRTRDARVFERLRAALRTRMEEQTTSKR